MGTGSIILCPNSFPAYSLISNINQYIKDYKATTGALPTIGDQTPLKKPVTPSFLKIFQVHFVILVLS